MPLNILVPYRNRAQHLEIFLERMSLFHSLSKEHVDITIIEQVDNRPFNRGKLLNVGFLNRTCETTYVALHDIDMIPGPDADYSFPKVPTHICTTPLYELYFGGISLFSVEDFIKVNGFHNEFWGWGGEDDLLLKRVMWKIGKYDRRNCSLTMLPHKKAETTAQDYNFNCHMLSVNPEPMLNGLTNCQYWIDEDTSTYYRHLKVKL